MANLSRYRDLTMDFYDKNLTLLSGGSTRKLLSVETTSSLSGLGTFTCTYPWPLGVTPAYGVLEQIGRIVVFSYNDHSYEFGFPGHMRALGEAYVIESLEAVSTGQGHIVRVGGRSLLSELERYLVWEPIGELTTYNTTLKIAVAGEITKTITEPATQGSKEITLNSTADVGETDLLDIPLTTGGTASMIVDSVEGLVVTLTGGLPGGVADNTTIGVWTRKITPNSTEGMNVGSKVVITLNSGSHATIVEEGATEPSGGGDKYVVLRDPLPSAAAIGKSIVVSDRSQPATNDIQQIVASAPGWSTSLNGIGDGGAHVPDGQSVLDLLRTVSDIHQTVFRLELLPVTLLPSRTITWGVQKSSPVSGENIIIANPPHAYLSNYQAANNGIVNGEFGNEESGPLFSRVYPTSGDEGVTLYGVSPDINILIEPNEVVNDPAVLGLYADPYVRNPVLEATGYVAGKIESFSEITAETDGTVSNTSASDMLAFAASAWLREKSSVGYNWTARDVQVNSTAQLFVGQTVDIHYFDTESQVRTLLQHNYYVRPDLLITDISSRWDAGSNRPVIDLTLNSRATGLESGAARTASRFRTYDRMVRRMAKGGISGKSVVVRSVPSAPPPSGGGGGNYLPLTGGTMTGNISFSGSQTVDGVDISAHAANASAHHAPVSAGNDALSVSGQAVSLVLSSSSGLRINTGVNPGLGIKLEVNSGLDTSVDGIRVMPATNSGIETVASGTKVKLDANPGLELGAGGLKVKLNATNPGLTVDGNGLRAKLDSASGLEINSGGLRVFLYPSTSGLYADSSGLRVSIHSNSGIESVVGGLRLGTPSTLSATSTNGVSSINHSHAITAYSNSQANYGNLLKSDSGGELAVKRIGIGNAAWQSGATAFIQSFSTSNHTLQLKQLASQTGDILRMENSSGQGLIRVTGGGDLESANPGFVSGMKGWQISANGDAEFNNIVARGELHATTFVADEMHATGGTFLVKTVTTVANPRPSTSDNILPAINGSFTLAVNGSYMTTYNYFPVGSIIRMKPMGPNTGGSLTLYDIYAEVTSVSSLGDRNLTLGIPGTYILTCTLRAGGRADAMGASVTGYEIPPGTAAVLWTKTGASGYVGGIKFTSEGDVTSAGDNASAGTDSPFIDVFTVDKKASGNWVGIFPAIKPRVRVGNLKGVLGKSGDEWGLAAGTDLSDTTTAAKYVVVSDLGVNMQNIDVSMYKSGVKTASLNQDGLAFLNLAAASAFEYEKTILWKNTSNERVGAIAVRRYNGAKQMYVGLGDENINFTYSDVNIQMWKMDSGPSPNYIEMTAHRIKTEGVLQAKQGIEVEYTGVGYGGVLWRSYEVAHGMTGLVDTDVAGWIKRQSSHNGGILVEGYSESKYAVIISAYGTDEDTTTTTSSDGAVIVGSSKKSGTGAASIGNTGNLLAIKNSGATRFIIKGNGNFYYDGTGSAYDDHDDIGLLRTLSREMWSGTIEDSWDEFLSYNRSNLVEAGIMSDEGFINGAALNRLLVGAIWQLNRKVNALTG